MQSARHRQYVALCAVAALALAARLFRRPKRCCSPIRAGVGPTCGVDPRNSLAWSHTDLRTLLPQAPALPGLFRGDGRRLSTVARPFSANASLVHERRQPVPLFAGFPLAAGLLGPHRLGDPDCSWRGLAVSAGAGRASCSAWELWPFASELTLLLKKRRRELSSLPPEILESLHKSLVGWACGNSRRFGPSSAIGIVPPLVEEIFLPRLPLGVLLLSIGRPLSAMT